MKPLRLVALTLVCSSFGFAVNKDLVAMQRALEDKIDALQQNVNQQVAQLSGMLTAMQNDTRRTADQVAGMQDALRSAVTNSLAPVTGLNNKVETTNEEMRALRDALADLSGRLERMDAKITDLNNKLQIMQNPPPAPGANPTGQPGANGPPQGMSAAQAYTDAFKDKQSGNVDLAYKEFQQYLQYFPNTEYAADAQYYLGEIEYNKRDYKSAIQSFDAVLERYPQNMKTRDARLMKGFALAKDGQRSKAAQELRALIQASPNSEQARRAQQALRDASLFPSASTANTRRRSQ
jgi:TolA-binding protein